MPTRRRRRLQPVPDNPGRVLLYVRVSALMGRGGEGFHSPAVQLDAMRRAIKERGLREVDVIDDDIDRSGRTFDRPGVARIRAMVEAKQVDAVAVHELSRVGRNLGESLLFIRWLRDHDVRIVSSVEQIDDTPEGQFMVGLWLGLAQLGSDQIGRRWSAVIERRARLGRAHGKPPQGYRHIDGKLQPDPELAPAVVEAFAAYAAGVPVAQIQKAYAAARGFMVSKSAVKVMLRNPIYAGRVVVHTSASGKLDMPGAHPALVDEATWDKVQRRMAADRLSPPRQLTPGYSLTGLLRCAVCGNNLQIWHSTEHGKDDPTRRAVCPRRREVGDCTGIGSPQYAPIEAEVLRGVREYAKQLRGNPAARAGQRDRVARAGSDVATLERELSDTREAMARLTERWARRQIPEATYDTAMARLQDDEQLQASHLDRAREVSAAPPPSKVVALVDRMLELWPEMTGAEQNRALKAVLRSVTVRRGAFWREPEADRVSDFEFRF